MQNLFPNPKIIPIQHFVNIYFHFLKSFYSVKWPSVRKKAVIQGFSSIKNKYLLHG